MELVAFVVLVQLFATGVAAVGSRRAVKRVLKIELIVLAVIEIPVWVMILSAGNEIQTDPSAAIVPVLIAVLGVVVVAAPLSVAAIRVAVLNQRDRKNQPKPPPRVAPERRYPPGPGIRLHL